MDKITITIDGHRLQVEAGTTVLAAARRIGIHIPTLCFVEGIDPVSSCFLCAVEVEGMPRLSPACALPVADGMEVVTQSDDVRAARKMALELLLSDHAGECLAPCATRCPAGLDVPGFVYEIAAGKNRQAMATISERLALPGSLGRICPRLCEERCRRCDHDESLAIATLHRYAADRDQDAPKPFVPACSEASGKSVGIVGAGPAGLAAAYYLLRQGHACTLYDAHSETGGMLRYGIPAYRLPRAALDAEIAAIRELGAEFRMETRWGSDFTLADLQRDHQAVFLGIGAQRSQGLRCEGEELALSGIGFLEGAAKGDPPALGDCVIVVGGGNTAMDAARTAVRLGAAQVKVVYRRTRREMPCLLEEVEAAEEEGVAIDYLVAPIGLKKLDDGALELTCQRMELGEPDASGRRRPVPIAGSEFAIECSTVVAAIGQAVDLTPAERDGVEVTRWGIHADARTHATNLSGVFAGGDAVLGADLAVRAVAAGRMAAVSIDQYLHGQPVTGPEEEWNIELRPVSDAERAELYREIEKSPRTPHPAIDRERRLGSFDEVEAGLSDEDAVRESRRCMSCGCRKAVGCLLRRYAAEYRVDPYRFVGERREFSQDLSHPEIIYEPGKCIMCDACVRIASAAQEELGVSIIGRGFDVAMAVPFDEPLSDGLRQVARRCAEACPTGALALRSQRSCDLGACAGCGVAFAGASDSREAVPQVEGP
ncbi:MAG: FAD-dependent oxidoreductase [bacterium]|nr:FAD-dependent oxidoreductase [bacterium]